VLIGSKRLKSKEIFRDYLCGKPVLQPESIPIKGDDSLMKSITFVLGICLFLILTLTAPSIAADINGKWIAPDNGVDIEFEFKVDGHKLKGNVYNPMFGKMGIKDGKIDGDNFSFYILHMNTQQRVVFKGVVAEPIIRITFRSAVQGLKEIVAARKQPEK
jgi:hypothetical protein